MENAQKYTEIQIALINEHLKEEQQLLNRTLLEIFEPPPPTALKSSAMLTSEQNAKVNDFMNFLQEDTKLALDFYRVECSPKNQQHLGDILGKIVSVVNTYAGIEGFNPITEEDCEFLEEMAKARLIREIYNEASCMYRFIVKINPLFSEAWVGWAVCEEEQRHMEVVDYIYQIATELLPFDYYLCLFAADFYISTDRKEKAKALLEKAKEQLEANHMESSKTYEKIQFSLNSL